MEGQKKVNLLKPNDFFNFEPVLINSVYYPKSFV